MNLVHHDIAEPLRWLVGATLERVVYHPLKEECTADDLHASDYIGGEIALHFQALAPRYISWAENAGWRSHFTVKVSPESAFVPSALETFDASSTNLWRETIGRKLTEVECLGWDQSPHVLKLTFEAYPRFIGSSFQKRFGDGDDLFCCDASDIPDLSGASVIWRNNKANQALQATAAAPRS